MVHSLGSSSSQISATTIPISVKGTLPSHVLLESDLLRLGNCAVFSLDDKKIDVYKPPEHGMSDAAIRQQRHRFREGLHFNSFPIKTCRAEFGQGRACLIFIWKIPLSADLYDETADARCIADVTAMLPMCVPSSGELIVRIKRHCIPRKKLGFLNSDIDTTFHLSESDFLCCTLSFVCGLY